MASELESNLSNYKLQLQQVEAALTTDPDNEDLQKLKIDLQEVLELTEELVRSQETAATLPAAAAAAPATDTKPQASGRKWTVGGKCLALYSEDNLYYEAVIDEILDDGTCTVTFDSYGNTDVTQESLLRPLEEGQKRSAEDGGEGSAAKKLNLTKKDKMAAEREYKRKKSQKKAQRQKQLEEEREQEKNKWMEFNAKTFSKTSKGRVKKSIFASPDAPTGRIGIGTCGVSGRPMTTFAQHEKWKK